MRPALLALLALLAAAACSKKSKPPPPKPRCVVTAQLPNLAVDAVKSEAPACSVTVVAPDATSFAEVIAAMDQLAKAGFVDFGVGDAVSKLPAPSATTTATRTTNEGLIIGRFDDLVSAPMIVVSQSGDVSVGGETVSTVGDANLRNKVGLALVKHAPPNAGSAASPGAIVISAHASRTYADIYRVTRAAADLGYTSFLFSSKNESASR
jgi:biopolymer transport protein ExbD